MRRGAVYLQDRLAGIIEETNGGDYLFQYDATYLASSSPDPVSLTLPLQKEPFHSNALFPFFDGLIPEGWLLDLSMQNWKLKANDRMGLLLATCEDCIGNVSIRNISDDS